MPLILASASPRRADLLAAAGLPFLVRPAAVDETPLTGETPRAYVERVARAKAWAVPTAPGEIVLGADTTVVLGERILGKPATQAEARGMLAALSGQTHDVLTGVVLRGDGREVAAVAETRVRFAPLSPAELDWYVESGEPEGKAGAYAIQGRASRFVEAIEGSYSNVVGLPVHLVYRLLGELGGAEGLAG